MAKSGCLSFLNLLGTNLSLHQTLGGVNRSTFGNYKNSKRYTHDTSKSTSAKASAVVIMLASTAPTLNTS